MKLENTFRFEEEKHELIDKLVEAFEEYREVIENELEKFRHSDYIVVRNTFNSELNSYRVAEKIEDIEPIVLLERHLDSMNYGYRYIQELEDSINRFLVKYEAYQNALNDLVHFYEVSGVLRKELLKIRQFRKCLKPLTEGPSDKADLQPLMKLKGAFNAIEDFKYTQRIQRIDYLLEQDYEGNIKANKNGQYIVNSDFFIDRYSKLKNNLREKYEMNYKAIHKIYRKHKTSDRLKRYLEFGR
ncbi:hypothetical protein [Staphylococcus aureus]|uniref:hypothetical protein n=1 Tax=Staphylococcus aureus TaxID=1280 RepID=UPI0018EC075F|nr:hypothetical protein [Staphylococcus aureus]MBJ6239731.1 hypothetical protein [Staphylococcus aureus]